MACRAAWIIHEQHGRVAVCRWVMKGGIGGLGVCTGEEGVAVTPSRTRG